MSEEEWRPVVGFEGVYEVSSLGRVKSLSREVMRSNGKNLPLKERILRSCPDQKGYLTSTISSPERKVHRIVCRAFHGSPPEGADQVRHLNGDPADNRPINLAWGTSSENAQDTKRLGRNWNLNKSHCPRGHPYEDGLIPGKSRRCEQCVEFRRGTKGEHQYAKHGELSTYTNWGCRCRGCLDSFLKYQKAYRKDKRENSILGFGNVGN